MNFKPLIILAPLFFSTIQGAHSSSNQDEFYLGLGPSTLPQIVIELRPRPMIKTPEDADKIYLRMSRLFAAIGMELHEKTIKPAQRPLMTFMQKSLALHLAPFKKTTKENLVSLVQQQVKLFARDAAPELGIELLDDEAVLINRILDRLEGMVDIEKLERRVSQMPAHEQWAFTQGFEAGIEESEILVRWTKVLLDLSKKAHDAKDLTQKEKLRPLLNVLIQGCVRTNEYYQTHSPTDNDPIRVVKFQQELENISRKDTLQYARILAILLNMKANINNIDDLKRLREAVISKLEEMAK